MRLASMTVDRRRIALQLQFILKHSIGTAALASAIGVFAGCHATPIKGEAVAHADGKEKVAESKYAWGRIRPKSSKVDETVTAGGIATAKSSTASVANAAAARSAEKAEVAKSPSAGRTIQQARFDGAVGKSGIETAQLKPVPASSTAKESPTRAGAVPAIAPPPPATLVGDLPPPAEVVMESTPTVGSSRRAASLMRPYGVNADQPGIADNISARVGMTYFDVGKENAVGGSLMLESSVQLGQSDRFFHAGVGTEFVDSEWPISTTIGFSKLATIEGDCVTKPGIFSVAYDSYFDSSYFGTKDNIYIDQIRFLAGWAISPRTDIGMWAAIGLGGDGGTITTPAGVGFIPARFGDRVAGYVSSNIGNRGSLLIASAGWEEGPGRVFGEADLFVPITDSVNLFGGFGYSDAKSFDAIVGVEITPSNWHVKHRRFRGETGVVDDPCADACGTAVCSTVGCDAACGPTYRGGWANGNYRGALRLISPSRLRRMIEDPNLHLAGAAPGVPGVPKVILAPDVPTPELPAKPDQPVPGVGGNEPPQKPPVKETPPVVCPPPAVTSDVCVPRILTRPKRTSTLSQLIATGGKVE